MMDAKTKDVALSVLKNLMDEMDDMGAMKVMMVGKKKNEMEDDQTEKKKPSFMSKDSLRKMLEE